MLPATGERAAAVEQRAAAAVAAMKGSIEREDLHQMETFSQLKTIRALLAARTRWGHVTIVHVSEATQLSACSAAWAAAAHVGELLGELYAAVDTITKVIACGLLVCTGATLLRLGSCCWSCPSCRWSRPACACARCRRSSCTRRFWTACPG